MALEDTQAYNQIVNSDFPLEEKLTIIGQLRGIYDAGAFHSNISNIDTAFTWRATPQGQLYWEIICRMLRTNNGAGGGIPNVVRYEPPKKKEKVYAQIFE